MTVTYETGLRFIPDPYLVLRREDRYLATLRKDVERTSLMLSGGLIEYRDVKYKHLQNTDFRLSGTISHAITTKSKMTLSLTADRLDDNQAGTSTERYLTGVRFEHMPTENITLSLDYRYTNVYSQYNYLETYDNNRFTVGFRKLF
jgi:opacity protein-like surface antigen